MSKILILISGNRFLMNKIKIKLLMNRLIGLVGRVFTNGPGDLLKMVLDTYLLNTQ